MGIRIIHKNLYLYHIINSLLKSPIIQLETAKSTKRKNRFSRKKRQKKKKKKWGIDKKKEQVNSKNEWIDHDDEHAAQGVFKQRLITQASAYHREHSFSHMELLLSSSSSFIHCQSLPFRQLPDSISQPIVHTIDRVANRDDWNMYAIVVANSLCPHVRYKTIEGQWNQWALKIPPPVLDMCPWQIEAIVHVSLDPRDRANCQNQRTWIIAFVVDHYGNG